MKWRLLKVKLAKKTFPRKFFKPNPAQLPFVARWIKKKLLEGDEMFVLPRDEVVPINKELDKPENYILPSKLVEHYIEKAGYIVLMHVCLCRDALGCKDYPISPGCLYMGDGARNVHPDHGQEITKEEALRHVRKSRELGLVHLIGRSKLDTVTYSIGPGEKLMAICNCCPCCCVGRGMAYGHPILGEKFSRMPGTEIVVTDNCQACGTCATEDICIFQAITLKDGRCEIDHTKCRGCSRCVSACPNHAIEVQIENEDYLTQSIELLDRAVDVT